MNRISKVAVLGLAASFAVVTPTFAAKGGVGQGGDANHGPKGYESGDGVYTYDCPDADGVLEFDGATLLWPPNHRQVDFLAAADADDDAAMVTLVLTVDASASDESFTSDDFGGDLDVSGEGRAETTAYVVRERAGYTDQLEGRVYEISFDATFDGEMCDQEGPVDFIVRVPHDMRKDNRAFDDNAEWSKA